MVAEVLAGLLMVSVCIGRIEQGQTQGLVVGLIGTEFAVLKNTNSEISRFIGQVKPFAGRDFVFFLIVR